MTRAELQTALDDAYQAALGASMAAESVELNSHGDDLPKALSFLTFESARRIKEIRDAHQKIYEAGLPAV